MAHVFSAIFKLRDRTQLVCLVISASRRFSSSFGGATPVKLSSTLYGTNREKGTPLVIMHGLMGSKQNWNSLAKAINAQTLRQVITVDLRNHGDSPHTAEMTYDHMASDVENLIKEQGLSSLVVVGHSMGGRAAMHLALIKPDLIEKLVVVDISPIGSSPSLHGMKRYFEALRSLNLEKGIPMSEARKSVSRQLAKNVPDEAVRQFLITNLVQDGDGSYKWRVNIEALEANFSSEIAQFPSHDSDVFSKPSLLIAGAESDYVKRADKSAINKLFPAMEIKYIAGAGHWVHAEQPGLFLEALYNFLNKHE